MRRFPVIGLIVALVAAGIVVDRLVDRPAPEPVSEVSASGTPTAAGASALSSTWYCAGGASNPASPYNGGLTVANPTDRDVTGTVSIVSDQGATASVPITVKASAAVTLEYGQSMAPAYVAATVDLDSGQVVVEHWVASAAGRSVAPCASRASTSWFFADGATARDAQLLLALYNPFPEDAIADLSFATNEGRAAPADFQGIVVPAGRVVVRDIGEHVRRRDTVATEVRLRSGRLVADQLLNRTAPGQAGVALRLGASAPALEWYFPDGYYTDGIVEEYAVFNPTDAEALVDVEVTLDEGAAEPFELTVPPHGRVSVTAHAEERLPKNVGRAVVVRSVNNVPVVAERSVAAAAPAPRSGRSGLLGATRTARVWAFAYGAATPTSDEWIIVFNPSDRETTVSITALADGRMLPVEGLQGVIIAPGRRQGFRLNEHVQRPALPLVVRSSERVVVQRDVFTVGGPGIADAMGIPLD
ncbi:MAG TPA: DUF5719 family protein [Acidimicrobiales bacterium]|nr:DUF5719 family protein [Acidimicrobiales bacterium]